MLTMMKKRDLNSRGNMRVNNTESYVKQEIEIAQKALKRNCNRIMRDFREIQNLKTREAKEKIIDKLKGILLKEISFDLYQETRYEVSECEIDTGWSLQVLDGAVNMLTGVPLMMMMTTLFLHQIPTLSLAYFPFTDETILCEADKGVQLLDAMSIGRLNITDKNPILAANSGVTLEFDKTYFNADLIAIVFTAIGRIDGFALKLPQWVDSIANLYTKEGGNKAIKIGSLTIGGNKAVQNLIKDKLLENIN